MGYSKVISPVLSSVTSVSRGAFHRVAYADWGGGGDVVLCLHGLTRQGRDFDFLAKALVAQGRRVVCPDLVGRGLSAWLREPRDYDVQQYVTDMTVLMASLGIHQLDWVGTSLGGLIGIVLAGRENSPIKRLVVNDVGPRLHPAAVFRIARYVKDAPPHFASLDEAEAYFRDVLEPFGPLSTAQWRHFARHSLRQEEAGGYTLHYDPRLTEGFRFPSFYEPDFWAAWDNIKCPVLVLRGSLSDLLLPQTVMEMAARNPRATIVEVPDAGHAPALAESDQLRIVTDWLNDSDAASDGAS